MASPCVFYLIVVVYTYGWLFVDCGENLDGSWKKLSWLRIFNLKNLAMSWKSCTFAADLKITAIMELKRNTIVKLRNGLVGVVTSFNDKPTHIIFKSYCNPITQYDSNLEKKNHDYDIMSIYDGSKLEKITDVWNKSDVLEGFELLWERK